MVGVLGFCTTPGSYVQNHRIFPGFYARSDTGWLNPNVGCRLDNREEGHHARVLQWNVGVARQHGACSIPVTPCRQDHHLSGRQRDCRRLQEELLTKRCAHIGCASIFVLSGHRAGRPLAVACSAEGTETSSILGGWPLAVACSCSGTPRHPGIEVPRLFCEPGTFNIERRGRINGESAIPQTGHLRTCGRPVVLRATAVREAMNRSPPCRVPQ